MSWRMSGLRVTMPLPRGRKSLEDWNVSFMVELTIHFCSSSLSIFVPFMAEIVTFIVDFSALGSEAAVAAYVAAAAALPHIVNQQIDKGQLTQHLCRSKAFKCMLTRHFSTYLPTKFSKTDDFPADCPPTTAIWGKSITIGTPSWVKASCIRFMMGIRASIPRLPVPWAMFKGTWAQPFHKFYCVGCHQSFDSSILFALMIRLSVLSCRLSCTHHHQLLLILKSHALLRFSYRKEPFF